MIQVPKWVVGSVAAVLLLGLLLTGPPSADAQPSAANEGKRYAVLVGVEGYFHDDLKGLKYAVDDATAFGAVLKTSGYEVVLLTDETGKKDKSQAPTKENIEREIHKTLRRCGPQDTVVLAFAGHGLQFTGKDAYFCPQDARPFPDETDSLVSISGIYRELEKSFAGVKIIMVDACRNDPDPGRGPGRRVDADSAPPPPKGVAALFSCSSGQRAFEHDVLRHGVFFHHVLKGFAGEGSDGRGNVTFYSLASYLGESVPQTMTQLFPGRQQSPNLKADLEGLPPVLARITSPAGMATPAAEAVTATFTILFGDADGPPAGGVTVDLLYRATASDSTVSIVRGTANAEGRATLRVTPSEQQRRSGDFLARVTHEGATKTWTLKNDRDRFPELLNWRIYAPQQGTPSMKVPEGTQARKAGDVRIANERLGLKMVWCPPGKFWMGSPASEAGRDDNEDQVEVTLTQGFWFGQTEVTQGLWKSVMGTEPWKGQEFVKEGPGYAASYISWEDAMAFCRKLTEQERRAGRLGDDEEYTLPTEAQWEYACRAGTTTPFNFGDDESQFSIHAWWGGSIGNGNAQNEQYAHAVGQKRANVWNLHDMHGNVWEWCCDSYEQVLPGGHDPEVKTESLFRVNRGGGWYFPPLSCRSANRRASSPDFRYGDTGFRVASRFRQENSGS